MGKYEKHIKISQSGKNRIINMIDTAQSNLFRLGLRIAETEINEIDLDNVLKNVRDVYTKMKDELEFIANWYNVNEG